MRGARRGVFLLNKRARSNPRRSPVTTQNGAPSGPWSEGITQSNHPLTPTGPKLHLGCGPITPSGWINVDGSWNAWLSKRGWLAGLLRGLKVVPQQDSDRQWNSNIKIHDVRRPLPFPDNSIAAIYASHLLEHLYLDEAVRLLRECYRVLSHGGFLRVVVPDVRAIVTDYLAAATSSVESTEADNPPVAPADMLNRRLGLRSPSAPTGNPVYQLYSSLKDFHSHKWMYDAVSLQDRFMAAGFVDVVQMAFRQSHISGIDEVEMPERVLNGEGVCIEGKKAAGRKEKAAHRISQ